MSSSDISTAPAAETLPPEIFKPYDIRGIVGKTLTPAIVERIGHAIGSEARARSAKTTVSGRDGRLSGPELVAALSRGLNAAGCDVIDIGRVPTPVLYFATHHLGTHSGVSITGSHNPPEYNGLKIMLAGETLSGGAGTGGGPGGEGGGDGGGVETCALPIYHLGTHSGVSITGSHNPPEYNGLKIMLAGETLSGEA